VISADRKEKRATRRCAPAARARWARTSIIARITTAKARKRSFLSKLHESASSCMKQNAIPELEDRPRPGDRVKLCGNHRRAGYCGVYLCDRQFYAEGASSAVVKIDYTHEEVFVLDPDRQMKKVNS
jgi:hypothetical protein